MKPLKNETYTYYYTLNNDEGQFPFDFSLNKTFDRWTLYVWDEIRGSWHKAAQKTYPLGVPPGDGLPVLHRYIREWVRNGCRHSFYPH